MTYRGTLKDIDSIMSIFDRCIYYRNLYFNRNLWKSDVSYMLNLFQKQMSKLYPDCSFSSHTFSRESVIGCERGKPCHFYMYAETNQIW